MSITARIQNWTHSNYSLFLLIVRTILGLILLIKGIYFISNSQQLKDMILNSRFAAGVTFLAAYTTFAHLFGGVFIILGLFTRMAVILQIPVLIGALFFIIPRQAFLNFWPELILSIIVLFLLIFILVKGSGEISMEEYLKKNLL
ncbi:MAG: DoxX family protein [Flavisolibacter sp.]